MNGRPLRVGMIGTGWMGEAIAPDFALCEEVELAAVAGRDADRTAAFAAAHGIPKALDVARLLEADEIELVYIASTHDSHAEIARAALEAGKPVLVEKAFTVDAASAEALVELANERGLFLMEAMWMRFNPVIRRVGALLAEGAIGEPRTLHASFGFAAPAGEGRLWDPLRAGGSLLDQGVYPLALADLVFGEPATVAAAGSRLDYDGADSGVDTEVAVLLGYEGGRQALCSTSIRSWLPLNASIGGAEGRIEIAPAFWCSSKFTLHRPGVDPVVEEQPIEGRGYVPMLRATAEAIAQGRTSHPWSDHDATLRVMRSVDRVFAALGH
ncbi:MAG TPA: Gfo/Idh/MocA family oxidoreductase [Glycomyces sp.]|nr:Gfo/Idh/MocA family oxidoreductase [Glycomyces sp.]